MIAFARTCAAIAATAAKREKIALVAAYLEPLDDADLAPAARYFTGNPFPQAQQRNLAIGGRTIVAAAAEVWGVDDQALSRPTARPATLVPRWAGSSELGRTWVCFARRLPPPGCMRCWSRSRTHPESMPESGAGSCASGSSPPATIRSKPPTSSRS